MIRQREFIARLGSAEGQSSSVRPRVKRSQSSSEVVTMPLGGSVAQQERTFR
jgi:hypothetical protein